MIRKPEPWQGTYDFIGLPQYLPGPRGLPLLKPPFGSIVAIDMNTGEHRWRIPVGRSAAMPSISKLGIRRTTGIALAQLGAGDQDGHDRRADGILRPAALRAGTQYADQATSTIATRICGSMTRPAAKCWREMELPANATGAPMTYMAGGKQFIVFPVGGGPLVEELIAVSL